MLQNVLQNGRLLTCVKQTLVSYTSAFSFVPFEALSELECSATRLKPVLRFLNFGGPELLIFIELRT